MSDVDELGDVLRGAVSRTCPECQHPNLFQSQECAACGKALPTLEDERSVSFTEGALIYHKAPLEEAWNLKLLSQAASAIAEGTCTLEEFRSAVGQVLNVAREGVELFESPMVQRELKSLPEEPAAILRRTGEHYLTFQSGCEQMLQADLENPAPAAAGLELVRVALSGIDRAEDAATDQLRLLHEPEDDDDDDDDDDDEDEEE